jgi:DNA mismatch endonuclease (patch repair protein)
MSERKRSEVMSRIRGKGNKDTEIALAKLLRANHITGWRRQQKIRILVARASPLAVVHHSALNVERSFVSIRPDFVFPKQRVAVFTDGCFWHGPPRRLSGVPHPFQPQNVAQKILHARHFILQSARQPVPG